jgi:scyllo-inositol 2-dehydrogenase (NADP+)
VFGFTFIAAVGHEGFSRNKLVGMPSIPVGLIGYGLGGSIFHAPLIQAVEGLRLAAVVTSQRERVEKDSPGVPVLATTAELLADSDIRLVVVASPSTTHFDVARAALRAGKSVVVDKPFTATAQEAQHLIDLAAEKGLFLSVYQNRRWDGDFLTVKKLIGDGVLGEIFHYEAHFDRFRLDIRTGWRETGGRGSGILYDLGAHLIDQAVHLFGLPRTVTADVFAQRRGAVAPDYFHLVLEYGRMRAILHGATVVKSPGPHFAVHGDQGSFVKYGMDPQEDALKAGARPGDRGWGVDDPSQYGELTDVDGAKRRVETLIGGYENYYQLVADAMLRGGGNPVDPKGSRDGLVVIEAAMRSAVERRTVGIL